MYLVRIYASDVPLVFPYHAQLESKGIVKNFFPRLLLIPHPLSMTTHIVTNGVFSVCVFYFLTIKFPFPHEEQIFVDKDNIHQQPILVPILRTSETGCNFDML